MLCKYLIFSLLLMMSCLSNASVPKAPGTLFIFVSFSMPEKLLEDYVVDAQKTQGTLVLQGLYKNSFPKTRIKIHEIFRRANTTAKVIIDPVLFEKHQITSVPALMLTNQSLDSCKEDADPTNYDLIYGAITLKHALKTIKEGGDQSRLSRRYLLNLGDSS